MKKIDSDGLLLCEIQADVFEKSINYLNSSSEIFIRRFMHSEVAKSFDDVSILYTNLQALDVLDLLNEEYGETSYGSTKFSKDEMYWMGYIYRYFAYTYDYSTLRVYKIIKPKELRTLYQPYHTLDPSGAIERIMESKGLLLSEEEELDRQYKIFKRIREEDFLKSSV